MASKCVGDDVKRHLEALLDLLCNKQTEDVSQVQKMVSIVEAVLSVARKKEKWPTWTKADTDIVYETIGLPPQPDKMSAAYKKKLLQINRMLCRAFNYLKISTGMKVAKMPPQNFYPRAHQAIEQDDEAFELLNEYHQILAWYQNHKPNFGTVNDTLQADLMLILIAFDGVLRKDADYRMAYLQKHHISLGSEAHMNLPLGKRDGYQHLVRVYPIGELSQLYFKLLLPRVKKVQGKLYLFPREWRQRKKAKVSRRVDLDARLKEMWRIVHPDRPVPEGWNIHMWIRLGRMSVSQLGVPYMVIASLTGKLRTAHLKRKSEHPSGEPAIVDASTVCEKESETVYDIKHDLMAEMLFLTVRDILLRYGYKENHMGPKKAAAAEIKELMDGYSTFLAATPNVKLLLEWVVWMLSGQKYRKNKISTFLTYISVMPCRLLPIMGTKLISELSSDEWVELASYLASDMEYAASSRRQTMTHLKSLYEFLEESLEEVASINWDDYAFRISKGIPEAHVVMPSEIDAILETLDVNDHRWIAIVLAFFSGLRCEEICGLKPSDILDEYKLQIGWSKRQTSRRSVPIGWLIPEPYWKQLLEIIKCKQESGETRIVSETNGDPIKPNTLGKRVARVLSDNSVSVSGIHALRHGFASWGLVRYFMLVDPDFYSKAMDGEICEGISRSHPMFSNDTLKRLARVFGGSPWEYAWVNMQCCPGLPTDMAVIAMLLGHTNRFTPIENYFNSMEWIVRHYLRERSMRISSLA